MAAKSFTPTEDQLKAVFRNPVQYEIIFTFGVPFHHPADYAQWEFINYTRAAHARLLYNFLSTPKANRHKDDAVAEDFGFPPCADLLSADDRDRLNKDLLHLSYSRLRHTPESKKWPDSILANLLAPTLDFMRHILENWCEVFATPRDAGGWQAIIQCLESGRELQVSAFTLDDSIAYLFGVGGKLPGGKPRFTRHLALAGLPFDS